MATIELVLDISLTVCAVILALVCVMAFIDTLATKFGAKKRKERERKEFLETMQLISDIVSKLPKEEKTKKKTTKKKEEK